ALFRELPQGGRSSLAPGAVREEAELAQRHFDAGAHGSLHPVRLLEVVPDRLALAHRLRGDPRHLEVVQLARWIFHPVSCEALVRSKRTPAWSPCGTISGVSCNARWPTAERRRYCLPGPPGSMLCGPAGDSRCESARCCSPLFSASVPFQTHSPVP